MWKIKKPIAFILAIAIISLFSSYNGRVKIKDRDIIQGMAVDAEQEGYSLTVQTYKPSSLQEPKNEYELHTAQGRTLFEALTSLNAITGQQAFFSNLQVIVLSRETLEKGLSPILDFFSRYSEIRKNVTVVASQCKAAELLTVDGETDILPAERIEKIMSFGTDSSNHDGSRLMDITERYLSNASDAFLPLLDVKEQDNSRTVKICGTLCFSGAHPSGVMSPEQSVGFDWISGFSSRQSIVLDTEIAVFTMSVQNTSCKISAKINDGVPLVNVELSVVCNLSEVESKQPEISQKDITEIIPLLSREVTSMAQSTVDKAFFELDSDIFKFGKVVRRDCPEFFNSQQIDSIPKSRWKINIAASADIYGIGRTNRTV